jgi:hypothetical protein
MAPIIPDLFSQKTGADSQSDLFQASHLLTAFRSSPVFRFRFILEAIRRPFLLMISSINWSMVWTGLLNTVKPVPTSRWLTPTGASLSRLSTTWLSRMPAAVLKLLYFDPVISDEKPEFLAPGKLRLKIGPGRPKARATLVSSFWMTHHPMSPLMSHSGSYTAPVPSEMPSLCSISF